MAGNVSGGKAAYETNKKRYGKDFMKRIGRIGGQNGHGGGFKDRELAKRAGAIGGKISKRRSKEDHYVPKPTFSGAEQPKKSLLDRMKGY